MDLSKFKSLSKLNLSSYLINEDGDIYSLKSNKILSKTLNQDGYVHNTLIGDNKQIIYTITHRLVGEMFLEKIDGKDIINHKDLNKTNNNYKNLEWCTIQENTKHAYDNGAIKNPMLRKEVSIKLSGENNYFYNKKGKDALNSIKVICLNDNKIFDCIREAADYYNVDRSSITKVCKGKLKHTKRFIFKYYKE